MGSSLCGMDSSGDDLGAVESDLSLDSIADAIEDIHDCRTKTIKTETGNKYFIPLCLYDKADGLQACVEEDGSTEIADIYLRPIIELVQLQGCAKNRGKQLFDKLQEKEPENGNISMKIWLCPFVQDFGFNDIAAYLLWRINQKRSHLEMKEKMGEDIIKSILKEQVDDGISLEHFNFTMEERREMGLFRIDWAKP